MVEVEILNPGTFASARATLQPGETFLSDSGAMVRMSGNITSEVTTLRREGGGVMGALKRVLAKESFFMSTYQTTDGLPGEVILAPTHQGDILTLESTATEKWVCSGGSFLGGESTLRLDPSFQGFKGFFTGEAPFFLNVIGDGKFFVNGFGRLSLIETHDGVAVDTGHLIAFTQGMEYKISKAAKGWISSMASGEGLVMRFSGKGKVIVQSHDPTRLGALIGPMLPPREA